MPRPITLTMTLAALASLSGCLLLNDVAAVAEPGYAPAADRALVVVGVKAEDARDSAQVGVQLLEYDMKRKSITGSCWRFNKIDGAVPARGPMRHLIFDAAPGYYAGGASSVAFLGGYGGAVAFEVPPGRVVYVADFVHTREGRLDLLRDIEAARLALAKSYPALKEELVLANATPIPGLQLFLCAP